ncbi:hypothetical protein CSPX01_00638, partial [Colletotrichum filicis]
IDYYPYVNRYKYGVDYPGWVNIYGTQYEDCIIISHTPDNTQDLLTLDSTTGRREGS